MTSDPERLLRSTSTDEGAELERELLRAVVDVSPPTSARAEAWDGIATRLGAAAAVAAGASAVVRAGASAAPKAASAALKSVAPPAVSGMAHVLGSKIIVGAVVAAGASAIAGGVYFDYTSRAHSAATAPASETSSPAMASPDEAPGVAPAVAPSRAPISAPATTDIVATPRNDTESVARAPGRPKTEDALGVVSAALTDARAALRRGNPHAALGTLKHLDAHAPRGVLGQEREVLAIQALAAAGDAAEARRRAGAFVVAYPNSPHTPALRHLAGAP